MIIDDVGKMICGIPIALKQHHIVKEPVLECHVSADQIVESGGAGLGNFETDYCAGGGTESEISAVFIITGRKMGSLLFGAHVSQSFGTAVTIVCVAVCNQFFGNFLVDIESFGLEVWAVGSADFRAFIPVDTEPSEAGEDIFNCTGYRSCDISVFDSYDEASSVMPGKEPVEESCSDIPYMGETSG
jgi:hypothetical protein